MSYVVLAPFLTFNLGLQVVLKRTTNTNTDGCLGRVARRDLASQLERNDLRLLKQATLFYPLYFAAAFDIFVRGMRSSSRRKDRSVASRSNLSGWGLLVHRDLNDSDGLGIPISTFLLLVHKHSYHLITSIALQLKNRSPT